MGGVAVLHQQDVLRERLNFNRMPLISTNLSNLSNSRGRNPNLNANRRKRSPQKKNNDVSRSPPSKSSNLGGDINGGFGSNSNLVMGKVKILKRGEGLNKGLTKKEGGEETVEMVLSRMGPEPEMVPKQIRLAADFYAGSAFDASPPPSSLPVPDFFFKKRAQEGEVMMKKKDESSSDLCRLLKLAGIDITP